MNNKRKDGPPLYVERSEVQQLCCSEFDILLGKVIIKSRDKKLETEQKSFCFEFDLLLGKVIIKSRDK